MRLLTARRAAIALALASVVGLQAADRLEQLTVDSTSGGVPFTATKIDPPNQVQSTRADCRLEGAEIRFTYDGTAPTTSVGVLLEQGDWLVLIGHDRLMKFRAIRTTATSGQLDCYYTP